MFKRGYRQVLKIPAQPQTQRKEAILNRSDLLQLPVRLPQNRTNQRIREGIKPSGCRETFLQKMRIPEQ